MPLKLNSVYLRDFYVSYYVSVFLKVLDASGFRKHVLDTNM